MKVVCKIKDNDGYYSKITPKKEYDLLRKEKLINPTHGLINSYYIITNDEGQPGYYLTKYFYTQQELRDIKLDSII